jgi:hypothetical protein
MGCSHHALRATSQRDRASRDPLRVAALRADKDNSFMLISLWRRGTLRCRRWRRYWARRRHWSRRRYSRRSRRRSLYSSGWRLGSSLSRLIENRSRLCFRNLGAYVGEQQAVDHEDGRENRRRSRQRCACTTGAEHCARRSRAETCTRLRALAALKQHEADDRERREHLHHCQNNSPHIRSTRPDWHMDADGHSGSATATRRP